MLSARDEGTAKSMITNLKQYLSSQEERDQAVLTNNLAYTLCQRRTNFPWVVATTAQDLSGLIENLEAKTLTPTYAAKMPRLGFVFNGQGAQWHAMGRELISVYPVFQASLKEADQCIKYFGAQWSLIGKTLSGRLGVCVPLKVCADLRLQTSSCATQKLLVSMNRCSA